MSNTYFFENLEEIKKEFENAEKNVEIGTNNILKLDLKFVLEVNKKKKNINISFNLKVSEKEFLSTEEDKCSFLSKSKNSNNSNMQSILKMSETFTHSFVSDFQNIILKYTSYKCPYCNKIPKIIFINDNKIMINCCEKFNYSVININDFLDILNQNYEKFEKKKFDYCENCKKNICKDCKKKNEVIEWENKINNLMYSEIKLDKKSSMKESEKLKERKEYTIDFTDKTDCNIYFKGEPIIGNNKYSPYLPECNELIDIIIHNTQFYNDSNHLENLENIYNFKKYQ